MYDFHMHSDYSIDCKYSMKEMALEAINKNMKCICFTDHIDLESTEKRIDILFHIEDYLKSVKQVKYKYINEIEILAGIEIGVQPHLGSRYKKIIDENPFDYIIASLHSVRGKDIVYDDYLKEKKPLEAIIEYYEDLYNCIDNFNDYDILGHIDLIDRHFSNIDLMPKFNEYEWVVEKILKKTIENGKGIELNTSGLRYGLNYYHPKIEILSMYKQLGGEIITIGSNAHKPSDIGYNYREAEKLLSELGFKYIFIFKERKKYPIHIN